MRPSATVSTARSTAGAPGVAAYPLPGQTEDIAVDPTDGRRVYVAVADKGVFRSEDAGKTFAQVASSFSAWGVAVGGTDGATVYYSGQNVFARSTDRGNTWTTQSVPFNAATTLLVDRVNPDLITANFQLNIGLSTDGGVTWTYIPSPVGAWIYAMYRVSATELIVGTTSGLHRSLDNGATFSWVGLRLDHTHRCESRESYDAPCFHRISLAAVSQRRRRRDLADVRHCAAHLVREAHVVRRGRTPDRGQ